MGNLLRNSHSKHVNIEEAVGSQILILPAYAWTGGCCIKHKLRCSLTVIQTAIRTYLAMKSVKIMWALFCTVAKRY